MHSEPIIGKIKDIRGQSSFRGTAGPSDTYSAIGYTILSPRACPHQAPRPTRPEGTPRPGTRPPLARLFVRPVGSTGSMPGWDSQSAPPFFSGAIYICLARIINIYGTAVSLLSPR